ncbi:MAG TPA: aldo/keto reductase, partial [Armatimonadota bacterium]|nr:aldo/keto reductase [Armatimonadota bacterium]
AAARYCAERGADLSQVALQFSLANPGIATTLVGTASPENIRKNVEWSEGLPDPELLAGVREILEPVRNTTWATGRPENA